MRRNEGQEYKSKYIIKIISFLKWFMLELLMDTEGVVQILKCITYKLMLVVERI